MILQFVAKTRTALVTLESVSQVGRILQDLSEGFLGKVLVLDEDDEGEEHHLDEVGAMYGRVQRELDRSEARDEFWRKQLNVAPDQLPSPARGGDLYYTTPDASKTVHFCFSERGLAHRPDGWMFANYLSLTHEISLYGTALLKASLSVCTRIYEHPLFDYGYCCVSEEYEANNIDRTGGGYAAVGLDVSKSLPGFYWGNYFGKFLCNFFGAERLMNVPGCTCRKLGSGIFVVNRLPPDQWSDTYYRSISRQAMGHLGSEYFFEKGKELTGKLFADE